MDRHNTVPSDNKGMVFIAFTVPKHGADAMPAGDYIAFFAEILHIGQKRAIPLILPRFDVILLRCRFTNFNAQIVINRASCWCVPAIFQVKNARIVDQIKL